MREITRAILSTALAVLWVLLVEVIAPTSALDSVCQASDPSPTLTMFVDPLPIPPSITLTNATLTIGAYKISQKMHRDLPNTTLYAFGMTSSDAAYPGYTLEARRNSPAHVYWTNHIPDAKHFLPVDRSINWANPPIGGVPTVTHLHGAETQSFYDGHPDAWFTQYGDRGPKYTTEYYKYPNAQKPAMLWYHDHAVGITRLNVVAGLTGLYVLLSTADQTLTNMFPYGTVEIPVVLKDLQFWTNGSINFPNTGISTAIHPQWCPEYFGDTVVVNRKVWPYLTIYPRFYRFRFLNGANARFFNFSMSNPSLSFIKFGTDGGYLPGQWSVQVVKSLLIAPAERYDIIVNFWGLAPVSVVYLNNSAPAPFPGGGFKSQGTNSVMQFEVAAWPTETTDFGPSQSDVMSAVNQARNGSGNPFTNYSTALHRYLTLQEFDDADGNPIVFSLGNRSWTDPVTEMPKQNAIEVWEMINLTPDAHPIHVHLIGIQVINQQPFDQNYRYVQHNNLVWETGDVLHGATAPPAIYQTGLKDSAIVLPAYVTRYGMHFIASSGGSFTFDPSVGPGSVWHCHILDHEDNDMMRPYKVLSP